MRFRDKVIVVTGAGTGIGASAARMFLEEGAQVIACQNRTEAEHASRRVTLNLADAGSVREAASQMPKSIDCLCNIAGLGADGGTPEDVIAVNFIHTRLFTELIVDRVAKKGCVLNTASVAGRYWRRDIALVRELLAMRDSKDTAPFWEEQQREPQFAYTLAKAALIVWTMQQAVAHVKAGPRFVSLSPGFTDTPMLRRAFAKGNETVRKLAESNNSISTPDDVAKVALFLCSDDARVINGVDILADAALVANTNCQEYQLK